MNSIGYLLSDLLQLGLPIDFYNGYVGRVSALTVPQIEDAARDLLDPRHMAWMIVGDKSTLEEPLIKLQIGDIVTLEA